MYIEILDRPRSHGKHVIRENGGKPRVYLAGKIGPHGWRDKLHGEVRGISEEEAFAPDLEVEFDSFILTGPFFVGCDHQCSHGAASHGAGVGCSGGDEDRDERHNKVHTANIKRIQRADILFAHINEDDCFGTIAEIGYARALRKRVVICVGSNANAYWQGELWFVARFADKIVFGDPAKAFNELMSTEL